MKRPRAAAAAMLAVFYLPLLPEILGRRLLVFRDAFVTHFPIKLHTLHLLQGGVVPFLNFGASHGEPLLADPNTFSLYPTNILYFVLPSAAAFNLHLLLHVALAFFGAAALARRLGASRPASLAGGAAYAFSGAYLSYASAFSNSAAAAAWAPWVVDQAVRAARSLARGRRRDAWRAALAAGIALGLQTLAGEPAISAWTAVFAAALAVGAAGPSAAGRLRLLAIGVAAAALGALLAAPQILPTAAAIPLSFRGEHLFSRQQFNAGPNVPIRLLESLFPLLFGSPRPMVSGAFWAYRLFDSLQPYLFSVNLGLACVVLVVAAALALRNFRASPAVRALAGISLLFLLLSFGFGTRLFEVLYAVPALRHFRYPIKFVLPFSLGFSSLVALAVDAWLETPRQRTLRGWTAAAAALAAAGGAATWLLRDPLTRWLEPGFRDLAYPAGAILPGIVRIVRIDALLGIAAMALLLAATRSRRPALILAAVLLGLLPMGWPLFVSVPSEPYLGTPALVKAAGGGRLYCAIRPDFLVARGGARHRFAGDDLAELIFAGRQELWPLTGLGDGVQYAFDTDPDGSYGFLDHVVGEAVAASPAPARARLLRACSVRYHLSDHPDLLPGFRPVAAEEVAGRTVYLSEAVSPVPIVRAASRIFRRSSLSGAVSLLRGEDFDAAHDAVLRGSDADPPAQAGGARILGTNLSGNGLSAEIDAPRGSVAVFAVTYFRYWKAAIDGVAARVEVADASFCGVRVPPGRHRVVLFYDEGPFRWGAAGTALFALLAALILARSRRRPSLPAPAE